VISFGGKLLALFEAGLPHRLDPVTLETLGEDTMGGSLKAALPVKMGIPDEFEPDFLGGHAVSFPTSSSSLSARIHSLTFILSCSTRHIHSNVQMVI
jgi:hypothetical protein